MASKRKKKEADVEANDAPETIANVSAKSLVLGEKHKQRVSKLQYDIEISINIKY
jgi:hypothetical protein